MGKRNFAVFAVCCALCFTACQKEADTDYFCTLVNEEQTILLGNVDTDRHMPIEKSVFHDLRTVGFSVFEDDYIIEKAEGDGLYCRILPKHKKNPDFTDFNVYQFGNFTAITCDRHFLEEKLEEAKQYENSAYAPLIRRIVVGSCNIGKAGIEKDDMESIAKVEACLEERFPNLSLEEYTMYTGGSDRTIVCYQKKGISLQTEPPEISWVSIPNDTEITIMVGNREVLDALAGVEKEV